MRLFSHIQIPSDIVDASNLSADELKVELAIHLFEEGRLPLDKAVTLAGLTPAEFSQRLNEHSIPVEDAKTDPHHLFEKYYPLPSHNEQVDTIFSDRFWVEAIRLSSYLSEIIGVSAASLKEFQQRSWLKKCVFRFLGIFGFKGNQRYIIPGRRMYDYLNNLIALTEFNPMNGQYDVRWNDYNRYFQTSKELDLSQLITDITPRIKDLVVWGGEKINVEIEQDLPDDLPKVWGYRVLLERAIISLFESVSGEYLETGTKEFRIRFACSNTDDFVTMEINDTRKEYSASVVDAFNEADNPFDASSQIPVNLLVSWWAIEAVGGQIRLSSGEAEEVLITFTLPTNLYQAYEGLRNNLRDDLKPSLSHWVLMHNEQECITAARWFNNPFEERPATFSIDEELDYELLSEEHPLFGIECQPIAYHRKNHNEFILLTPKPLMRITVVHLTWSREEKPEYPRVLGFASVAEFAKVMGIDAAEVIRNSVIDYETRI